MNQIKVNEIFFSIQGESSLMGLPTTFVRTSGCHLRCQYCDTKYAYHKGQKVTLEDILTSIKNYPTKQVCITGGEPLLQPAILPLMTTLCDEGFFVSIETSGDLPCDKIDPRVLKVIDIKTPGSLEEGRFEASNLALNPDNTEFKFVLCNTEDFQWAESFCKTHDLFSKFRIYYSPSHEEFPPHKLAEKILQQGSKARMQMQIHKYIWPEATHGF